MKSIFLKKNDLKIEEIPVGKILCLGKNYSEHAKEMGGDVPKSPIVFLKPSTAIADKDGKIEIPSISNELHHEVELVILIGKKGKNISKSDSQNYISGYGVGLDMTLRDQQSIAKKEGNPWTIAKGFDTSAIFGTFIEKEKVSNPENLDIQLTVNGIVKQKSNTSFMIFKINYTISFLSQIFTLELGDLIFMGTPEGVGRVISGDSLVGTISGLPEVRAFVK